MQLLIVLTAKYLYLVILATAATIWFLQTRRDKWRMGITAVVAGAIALALTKLAGKLYYDPRPFVVQHIQPLIAHGADNGFPSDHTVLTMTAALVVFQFSKRWGIALMIASLLVGCSRIAARVHSPLDVAASIVIAIIAAFTAQAVTPWVLRKLSTLAIVGQD